MAGVALPATIALMVSLLLTPVVRLVAKRLGIVAAPNPIVITHTSPTPYLGGIAVYLGFIAGLTCLGVTTTHIYIAGCTGLMVSLGCIDDIRPFCALHKLLAQAVVSIASLFLLGRVNPMLLNLESFTLCVLWLMTTTNALNSIDVMDGLATGSSVLIFMGLYVTSLVGAFRDLGGIALVFAAGLLGFLPFNRYHARIFLGDAGSLLIGFTFGITPLLEPRLVGQPRMLIALLLLFAVPLFEFGFISVMRFLAGKPFWIGSRDHFALRLLARGWHVPRICFSVYAVELIVVLAALLFLILYPGIAGWLIVGAAIAAALYFAKRLAGIAVAN